MLRELDRKLDRDGQDKSCRRKWLRNDKDGAEIRQDGAKMGPRCGQDGAKMVQDGAKVGQDGTKMAPRWSKMGQYGSRCDKMGQTCTRDAAKMGHDGPRWAQDGTKTEPRRAISPAFLQRFSGIPDCRPECAKKWPRNDKEGAKIGQDWARWGQDEPKMGPRWTQDGAKTVQDGAKVGQDAANMRDNESKKCGHSRQIRCFCKVGTIQRQRRAKNVLMKQVLVRGRTDRQEKEPKCGHCRGPKKVRVAGGGFRSSSG